MKYKTVHELISDPVFSQIISIYTQKRRAYFSPIQDIFSEKVDLTPHYGKDLKVGVVIGTCGALPYIDMQLHYLKNVNKIEHVLIHDDCSEQKDALKELAFSYGAEFYSTPTNLWHMESCGSIGDEDCFVSGLVWAKQKKLDILVKLSRRLVPCYNWINGFKDLVKRTDGLTFSSYCTKNKFPIRTECIGMNVNAWASKEVLAILCWYIQNNFPVFAEYFYNEIAKELSYYNNSKAYHIATKKNMYRSAGYVIWKDLLGTNKNSAEEKNSHVLWHNHSTTEDYYEKAKEIFGDKYKKEDFEGLVLI